MLSFEMLSVAIILTIFTLSTSKSLAVLQDVPANCITSPEMCTVGERCTFRGADLVNGFNVPRYSCVAPCGEGYRRSGVGDCVDVDECDFECDGDNMVCTNEPGSYSCDCISGFKLSGDACLSDTCDSFPDLCDASQDCVDVEGAFGCRAQCDEGFSRNDAGDCLDINECENDPCTGDNEACTNTPGGYSCDCADKYELLDGACVPKTCNNFPDVCGDTKECVGFAGFYTCMTKCTDGYERKGPSCVDIDECLGDACSGANEACTNTPGGYSCDCADKYELLDGACVPNTCNNFPDVCGETKECVRFENGFAGFYTCMTKCTDGYERKGPSCVDIDECLGDACSGDNEVCINSPGSYSCGCKEGYKIGSGGTCELPVLGTVKDENWVCAHNCWTRACSYCSSATNCALNYDLENNNITIRAKGSVRKYLRMVMYNEEGSKLGTLHFNSRGVYLWGCIACRGGLEYRPKITAEPQLWTIEKSGISLKIYCDDKLLYMTEFAGGCADRYGATVTKVAFQQPVFAEILSIPSMTPDAGFTATC